MGAAGVVVILLGPPTLAAAAAASGSSSAASSSRRAAAVRGGMATRACGGWCVRVGIAQRGGDGRGAAEYRQQGRTHARRRN
jgi:hypothetical protein